MKATFNNIENFTEENMKEIFDELSSQLTSNRFTSDTEIEWMSDNGHYHIKYQADEYEVKSAEISLLRKGGRR